MAGPARKQRRPTRVKRVGTAFVTAGELKSKEGDWRSIIIPSQGTRKKPLLLTTKEQIKKEINSATKKTDERIGFIVNEEETKIVEEKEE